MNILKTVASIILIVMATYYFFDLGFFKGEITEYELSCNKTKYINYQCVENWLPLNPTTFKPEKETQKVFYWNDTFPEIHTLNKCSVIDRKNWTCKYDDESAEFGFKDGQYWQISLPNGIKSIIVDDLEFKYVSKFEYRLHELGWR